MILLDKIIKTKKADKTIFDTLEIKDDYVLRYDALNNILVSMPHVPDILKKIMSFDIPETETEYDNVRFEIEEIDIKNHLSSLYWPAHDHHYYWYKHPGEELYKHAGYTVDFPKFIIKNKQNLLAIPVKAKTILSLFNNFCNKLLSAIDMNDYSKDDYAFQYLNLVVESIEDYIAFIEHHWYMNDALYIAKTCYK